MSGSGGMSPNTARRLAALIVADAEQLQEKAEAHGVTAFLGKAVQRERPNERFLQNTLKNLASANKRADERVMWAAWEAQKQSQERDGRHRGSGRARKRSRSRSGSRDRASRKRSRSRSGSRDRASRKQTDAELQRSRRLVGRDRAGGTEGSRKRSRSREDRRHSRSRSFERRETFKDDGSRRAGQRRGRGREPGSGRSRSRERQQRAHSNSPEWQEVPQDDADDVAGQGQGEGEDAEADRSTSRGEHCLQQRSRSRSPSGSDHGARQWPGSRSRSLDAEAGTGRQQYRSTRHAAVVAPAGEEAYPESRENSSDVCSGRTTSSSGGSMHQDRSAPDAGRKEASSDLFHASDDEQLVQWLASSKAVKGRGSIGPRADVSGPYLEAPSDLQQLLLLQQGVQKGPERPAWLPKVDGVGRLVPDAGFLRGVLRAQGVDAGPLPTGQDVRPQPGSGQREGKSKKSKKKKKKRRRESGSNSSSSSEDSSSSGSSRKRSSRKISSKLKRMKTKHKKHRKHRKQQQLKH